MTRLALLLTALYGLVPSLIAATELDAAEIMARVAENQDRAVAQRKEFVYHQRARVRLLKTNGKLLWDETREYDVTPTPDGTEFQLTRRYGERRKGGEFDTVHLPGDDETDGLDPQLVESFHDDFTTEHGSRDGLKPNFFPLTSAEQKVYCFTLDGEENHRGRDVYRLRFEPLEKRTGLWKGEVLVDKDEFQPAFVATKLALNIPAAVRVLFGINIRQIGFSVNYERFAEGVWFPVSYGGEFLLKIFHFYKRTVIVSSVNEDFRRASVESDILFDQTSAR